MMRSMCYFLVGLVMRLGKAVIQAVDAFLTMLCRFLYRLCRMVCWLACLTCLLTSALTGGMWLAGAGGIYGNMAWHYFCMALIAHVIMHLFAKLEYRSLDADNQQQVSAIARDEHGRIVLPPARNPWL